MKLFTCAYVFILSFLTNTYRPCMSSLDKPYLSVNQSVLSLTGIEMCSTSPSVDVSLSKKYFIHNTYIIEYNIYYFIQSAHVSLILYVILSIFFKYTKKIHQNDGIYDDKHFCPNFIQNGLIDH